MQLNNEIEIIFFAVMKYFFNSLSLFWCMINEIQLKILPVSDSLQEKWRVSSLIDL